MSACRTPRRAAALAAIATALASIAPATAFDLQGHRGARGLLPENTLAGFEKAIELGVTTLETDLAVTKDGVVVISHDPDLNPALVRGPSGFWLNARGPAIRTLSLAEVKAYDVGRVNPSTSYGKQWPRQLARDGERVPTLAEALKVAAGRGRLLLDLKVDGLAGPIAAALREEGMPVAAVVIATWTAEQRADVRQHLQGAAIAQAMEVPGDWTPADMARWRTEGVLILDVPNPRPDFVRAAHAHAISVWAFTINDVRRMRQVMVAGVDGFETDEPRLAAAYAGSGRVTR